MYKYQFSVTDFAEIYLLQPDIKALERCQIALLRKNAVGRDNENAYIFIEKVYGTTGIMFSFSCSRT